MFYIRNVFRNIGRYKKKSMLTVLICAVVVLFLNLYIGGLEESKEQIKGLSNKIPVEATISNLNGAREAGLFIKEALYEKVMKSELVKEPRFTLQMPAKLEDKECSLLAVNTWKAIPGAEDKNCSMTEKELAILFSSKEQECIVTSGFLERYGLRQGDEIELELEYYELVEHMKIYTYPLETARYRIIGVVEEGGTSGTMVSEIFVPIGTIQASYHSKAVKFSLDSGRFLAKNPLELNAFKGEMKQAGFMEVTAKASMALDGNALIVRDETFIRAVRNMERGYKVMRYVLPLVCIVLAGASFVISYLLVAGRREEYAVMRSQGMRLETCVRAYWLEYGILQVAGGSWVP